MKKVKRREGKGRELRGKLIVDEFVERDEGLIEEDDAPENQNKSQMDVCSRVDRK